MNDRAAESPTPDLTFEYELDAPPEKVWRAISRPELRARWLPDLAEAEPIASTPGEEVSYRLREPEPPFVESVVTLRVEPNGLGARLRIIHQLTDVRGARRPANDNRCIVMRAA
jgi:uncharacterized protein YndB with AHSA1/START domain